jgi:putative radical SAM enzyme (TIGR03279 family)
VSAPRVVTVAPGSPAKTAGVRPGDEILSIDGRAPRDVLEWRWLVDEADPELEIERGGLVETVVVEKAAGEVFGAEVHSSVFDRVQTCDNHCEFCFIYQLPKGMRRSLYLKDDDYRLSFLYGNFTTLTRFTELDLERVVTEGISPLHVSIHATDPGLRADMLRNRRGAMSLRWLRALLDHGVEVHGQVVVCPGTNDGDALDATLADVADQFPELASVAVVPLGVSDHAPPGTLREHTVAEAQAVVDIVESWQEAFLDVFGRRLVFAADEYYLLAERPFPEAEAYEGFPMHEDGVGMARAFEAELLGEVDDTIGVRSGFFHAVDGAPREGYRAERTGGSCGAGADGTVGVLLAPRRSAPVAILTGAYGARVLEPLISRLDRNDVRIVPVENRFFGGNIGVTGLMVGEDVARALADQPSGHRYLLPDVCLSGGRFLDDTSPDDLPHPVEIVTTDGASLRRALERR